MYCNVPVAYVTQAYLLVARVRVGSQRKCTRCIWLLDGSGAACGYSMSSVTAFFTSSYSFQPGVDITLCCISCPNIPLQHCLLLVRGGCCSPQPFCAAQVHSNEAEMHHLPLLKLLS